MKSTRRIAILLAFSSGVLFFVKVSTAYSDAQSQPLSSLFKNELIVKLKDSGPGPRMQSQVLSRLESRLGPNSVAQIRTLQTDRNLHVIRLTRSELVPNALALLRSESSVALAEPNQLVHALDQVMDDGLPNDPDFPTLWGTMNTGQYYSGQNGKPGADVHVQPLWREGVHGSRRIIVAVIDSGIDWTHPDLAANLYTNPKESGAEGSNGKDDDGNGFVDDIHGWNFVANNGDTRDDFNHGTHCAGTIGAIGNNGVGIAGVNWEVSLLPVKFLDAKGNGTLDRAIEAINYARIMKANVMNNSWGGGDYSEILKQAIESAKKEGILFVAAAGNSGADNDAGPTYPASYGVDNVLAVAATDNRDLLATFSNFGRTSVHVAAPGVKIYSTMRDGKYDVLSGTSMAAPYVAGAAALLLSDHPQWSYAEIKRRLIESSDPVQGLRKKVAAQGRINIHNAEHGVVTPHPVPAEPLWQNVDQRYESPHPYANTQNTVTAVHVPGAKYIRVHFEKIEVESVYDQLTIETPEGDRMEELTGQFTDRTSEYVEGDSLVVRLKTDYSGNRFGFKIDHVQVILP